MKHPNKITMCWHIISGKRLNFLSKNKIGQKSETDKFLYKLSYSPNYWRSEENTMILGITSVLSSNYIPDRKKMVSGYAGNSRYFEVSKICGARNMGNFVGYLFRGSPFYILRCIVSSIGKYLVSLYLKLTLTRRRGGQMAPH